MKYLFLALFCSSCAMAQNFSPEFKLNGELDFFYELGHRPTSIQGRTAFDFALLQLSPEIKLDEDLSIAFRFVLAEERSATEKNYLNQVQNAFIRYQDSRFKKLKHELGLIRSAWIVNEGSASQFDFFGDSSRSLARRYGLQSEGDLGYQARYQQNEKWEFIFGVSNGEENAKDEQGPNKQSFFGAFFNGEKMNFNFWLSSGRVDRYDSQVNEKNRALLRFEYRLGRLVAALEGAYAKDPSQDLEDKGHLDGITFTELTTVREIETTGGRIDLMYDLSDKQRFLIRHDQLTPQWKRKEIRSSELGWIKRESARMVWGVFLEKTEFGAQHSSQSKLRERARLGIEIAF